MTSANDLFFRAIERLDAGDMDAGWPLYEARIDHPDWVPWALRDGVAQNRERMLRPGEPVAGRDIVVFTEQGLGDNIMFARYLPLLARRGARVTLACPPALQPIFERIDGVATVLSPPDNHPDGKLNLSALRFDAFVPLLSLPYVFGTTAQNMPARTPYLRIDPARVAAWRDRYVAQGRPGRRRVGLVFHSENTTASAAARSLALEDAIALAGASDIDFVNLQPGPAGRAFMAAVPNAIDATAEPLGLDEYAAAIAATDLLICVDTMAAHCAGAMGHPVWVLLPRRGDWRWGRGPTRTPWYPSAELLRQNDDGWRPVVEQVRQRLHTPADRTALAAAAIERGIRQHRQQDLEAAIESYRSALGHDPRSAQALCNLGLACAGLLRHDEAMAAFESAERIAPDAPLVRLNKAQLLLMLGRWQEGWDEYEWRWKLPRRQRTPLAPAWDGSPVGTRTLLLFSELGLGDTIQMLRYLPLVVRTKAPGGRVLLTCQPPLRRLLSAIPGIEIVLESDPVPPIDAELPLCSLPRLFATRPDTVPPQPPDLFIPADSAAAQRVRAEPRPRIGIVWAGNPGMLNDDVRSMPLAALAPLLRLPNLTLFSLQKGEAAEAQLATAGFGNRIIPLGPLLHDMADTAAAIREMDLVIAVCTSVAHLAASLNKPTWLMLSYPSEWRWMLGRDDTPWYPSMRIFRQDRRGDWDGVVSRIVKALTATPPATPEHPAGSAG